MVHKDRIIKDVEFSYEGVLDFKDFLSMLKSFFKRHKYDVEEKTYVVSTKNGLKNTKMKWSAERMLDDYNKAYIKLKIGLSDYKEAYVESTKVVDGKLRVEFEVDIERDYNEQWKGSPAKKFVRALYEKYVSSGKQKKVDDSVRDVVDSLLKEMKQYLKA